ncbi:hypothetical protein SAMN04487948_105135 [Halogranum amylolyticum]|uniref:Uncharacterized protein n=1 Tax=Halogranum amylolyticum TaxID=660520 RepID=A0A1H8SK17_9EURY|nr:hypothetical protein [Halogranum amylolyticum]SEO78628.1 hypothetical protein SAMN04487948_105135 [Halogranum amylolyticum]
MPSNPFRNVLLGGRESVGRLVALTAIGVFLTFYSQILGEFGGLDDVVEPGVWSAYLSFAPLFVVGYACGRGLAALGVGGIRTGQVE